MKTNNIYYLSAAAFFAVVSCGKDIPAEEFRLSENICISIEAQTRTMLSRDGSTLLLNTDTLMVFDDRMEGVKFSTLSNQVQKAIFTTSHWTGNNPEYAVIMSDYSKLSYPSKGVFGIYIPSEQTVTAPGSHDPAAGCCIGRVEELYGNYYVNGMKDVPAFVRVDLKDDKVAKVVVEGTDNEPVAGYLDANLEKMLSGGEDIWTETAGKVMASKVTAVPGDTVATAKNCFLPGSYYVAVAPRTYAKGLNISFLGVSGDTLKHRLFNAKTGVTLKSGKMFSVDFDSMADTYPDNVVIDLNFHNLELVNPLGFGAKATFARKQGVGETWHFNYEYDYAGTWMSDKLPFIICAAGTKGYEYRALGAVNWSTNKYGFLLIDDAGSWIKIPGIPGKYLKEVYIAIENAAFKSVRICSSSSKNDVLAYTFDKSKAGTGLLNEQMMTFPWTFPESSDATLNAKAGQTSRTEAGTPYYIYFDLGANHVCRITLTYSPGLE